MGLKAEITRWLSKVFREFTYDFQAHDLHGDTAFVRKASIVNEKTGRAGAMVLCVVDQSDLCKAIDDLLRAKCDSVQYLDPGPIALESAEDDDDDSPKVIVIEHAEAEDVN